MESEKLFIKQGKYILDSGKMVKEMGLDKLLKLLEINLLEYGKKERKKE